MTAVKRTPRWLREVIDLNASRAKPTTCPNCHADVLAGLDNNPCGVPAVADATPVTYLEAVAGILDGRGVYALMYGELNRLHAAQLVRGGPDLPLLLEHHCRPFVPTPGGPDAA